MHIHTIEENFDYQMSKTIKNFRRRFDLGNISGEELQEKVWNDKNLLAEFGKVCIEAVNDYDENIFDEEYKA